MMMDESSFVNAALPLALSGVTVAQFALAGLAALLRRVSRRPAAVEDEGQEGGADLQQYCAVRFDDDDPHTKASFASSGAAHESDDAVAHEAADPDVAAVLIDLLGGVDNIAAVKRLLDRGGRDDAGELDCAVPLADVLNVFARVGAIAHAVDRVALVQQLDRPGRRPGIRRAIGVLRCWARTLRAFSLSALGRVAKSHLGAGFRMLDGAAQDNPMQDLGVMDDLVEAEALCATLAASDELHPKISARLLGPATRTVDAVLAVAAQRQARAANDDAPPPRIGAADFDIDALLPALWKFGIIAADGAAERVAIVERFSAAIRRRHRRNLRYFLRHMIAHAVESFTSAAVSAGMIIVSGAIQSFAMVFRSRIESAACAGPITPARFATVIRFTVLELVRASAQRLASDAVAARMRDVIVRGREATKASLHFAFTRLPMSFFATTDPDRIDEVLNYPNDVEGLEVKLLQCAVGIAQTVWAASTGLRLQRQSSAVLLVVALVGVGTHVARDRMRALASRIHNAEATVDRESHETKGLEHLIREARRAKMEEESRDDSVAAEASAAMNEDASLAAAPDVQNRRCGPREWFFADDATQLSDIRNDAAVPGVDVGVVLEPSETVRFLHLLRPIGADIEQMTSWYRLLSIINRRNDRRATATAFSVRRLRRFAMMHVPYVLHAAASTLDLVITPCLSVMIANSIVCSEAQPLTLSMALTLHTVVTQLTSATRALLDVIDIVRLHAHKAYVVHRLLEPAAWENRSDAQQWAREAIPRAAYFTNVTFAYPTRPDRPVLRSFTLPGGLPFPDGCIVAITGESGCGKSTMLKLLLGLFSAESGTVELELEQPESPTGRPAVVPLQTIDLPVLRRTMFSYVPQQQASQPLVFPSCTVAENIACTSLSLHRPAELDAAIAECAVAAQCHRFIQALPERYNTPMNSTASVSLSPGQMTRIAIARGLFRGGRVLLLDEPTTGVDGATVGALITSLKRHVNKNSSATKCVVCVTHDERLIASADVVVHLDAPHDGLSDAGDFTADFLAE